MKNGKLCFVNINAVDGLYSTKHNFSVLHFESSVPTHSGQRVISPSITAFRDPAVRRRNSLSCPALEDFIDSITLFAAELLIRQVRVVNNLGNDLDLRYES